MTSYAIVKVHDGVYLPTPRPVTLPAMRPGDSVRVTMYDDGGFDVVPLAAEDFLNTDAIDGDLYDANGERVWSGGGLLVRVDAEQENDR